MAVGTVTVVTGTVTALSADGGRRILQVGDRIDATDILETADGASLVVALDGGGSLDMGGNDRMALGDALPDGGDITGNGQAQASGPSVEDIQAALLAGQDPTKVADPTAAGAPAAGGGPGGGNEGHGIVSIDYLNPVAPVNNGFDTIGPVVAFNDIAPQVLLLDPRRLPATADGGLNQPPIAVDDGSSGLPAGTPVTLDVLGNDSDPDGSLDPTSVQIVGTAAPGQSLTVAGEGVWSVDPVSGAITFTPAADFVGDPSPIQYTVADNLGLRSDPATVSIDYNLPPAAGDDGISGLVPGNAATLTVLSNDSDPDGSVDPTSIQIVGTSAPGQALVVAGQGTWSIDLGSGTITFTPIAGFIGDPTPIQYTIADNLGLRSEPATVSVDYAPAVTALDSAVDESDADRSVTAALTIDGAAPASVTLAAVGATWNPATQTLTDDGGHYTVKVENGTYQFTLLQPLTHTGSGNPLAFDISASLTAADGSSANTDFTVTVYDDGPTVTNANGQLKDSVGEALTQLIDYDLGFDGLGSVTLNLPEISANGAPWQLTSDADAVSFAVADTNGDGLDEIYAFIDKGPQGLDASDRMVFTLTPTQNGSAIGDYTLTLYQVLDLPPADSVTLGFGTTNTGPAGQVAVGNSLLVTGSDLNIANGHIGIGNASLDKGESITYQFGTVDNFDVSVKQLVNSVQLQEFNTNSGADAFRWTAYRDGAVVGSKTVSFTATAGGDYAPAITVDGGYDTLKIQVISGGFEVGGLKYLNLPNTQQLDLKFGFTATDGDGDSVTGSFTVDTGALLTTQLQTPASVLEHPDSLHALSTP